MARASARTGEVRITLELSEREATVLQTVLCAVGGSHQGPRGAVEAIIRALQAAKVRDSQRLLRSLSESLYLRDRW